MSGPVSGVDQEMIEGLVGRWVTRARECRALIAHLDKDDSDNALRARAEAWEQAAAEVNKWLYPEEGM